MVSCITYSHVALYVYILDTVLSYIRLCYMYGTPDPKCKAAEQVSWTLLVLVAMRLLLLMTQILHSLKGPKL